MRRPFIVIGAIVVGVVFLCCVGGLVLGLIGNTTTPATRTAATAAPAAGGLSTTPAADGGPSPAEAATFTAVARSVQGSRAPGTPVQDQPAATTRPAQPTNTPRPGPSPTPQAAVGQPIRTDNWEFTVQGAQRMKEYTWSSFGNKDTAIGEYVFVPLRVGNIGNRNFGLNAFDFELYDAQNRKYSQATNATGFGEWLKQQGRQPMCGQCPPGTAIDTGVIFDVSPGLTGLRLRIVQARRDVPLP